VFVGGAEGSEGARSVSDSSSTGLYPLTDFRIKAVGGVDCCVVAKLR